MVPSAVRSMRLARPGKMVGIEIADKNSANIEEYFVARQIIYLVAGLIEP